MLTYLKYRWALFRLQAKQNNDVKYYHKLIKEARQQGKKGDDIESLRAEASAVYGERQEEIDILGKNCLIGTAKKLMIPIPEVKKEPEGIWEYRFGRYFLTEKGIDHLKKAITRERKERNEVSLFLGLRHSQV